MWPGPSIITRTSSFHAWHVSSPSVFNSLLRLLLDHLKVEINVQVLELLHASERLVNRHRPDGHWRVPQNLLPDHRDVAAGRQVHHRISTEVDRRVQLAQFLVHIRND